MRLIFRRNQHHFAAVVLVGVVAVAVQGAENPKCPCLKSAPPTVWGPHLSADGKNVLYQGHRYPLDYGLGQGCKAFDADPVWLQPHCGDAQGNALPDAPAWCEEQWCYVDRDNCDLPLKFKSGLFPDSELYYSYQTCGSQGTFVDWFGNGSSGTHKITELAQLVEDYVLGARKELEESYIELSASASCSVKSSCPCDSCAEIPNSAWAKTKSKVDLSSSVFIPRAGVTPDSKSQCMSAVSHSLFSRIAAKEYTSDDRLGWLYGGLQSDGSYSQWPAQQWCPGSDWDPRFRPWYSAAASGPKNVVLIIDTSVSMLENGRIEKAREAAKSILRTLSWQDSIVVLRFSSSMSSSATKLDRLSEEHHEKLDQWIDDNLLPSGQTTFYDPLMYALDLIQAAPPSCNNVILFLTDGKASFTDSQFSEFASRASSLKTVLFGYALGDQADKHLVKRLSCATNGMFYHVADGDNLAGTMSSYYQYFTAMQNPKSSRELVRWIKYTDVITGTELLTACSSVLKNGSATELIGVVCMDVSIIVPLKDLQDRPDFSRLSVKVNADSSKCSNLELAEGKLQLLLESLRGHQAQMGSETCGSNDSYDLVSLTQSEGVSAVIIGGAVAGGVVVCLLVALCIVCIRKRKLPERPAVENQEDSDVLKQPDPEHGSFVSAQGKAPETMDAPPPAYTPY